MGSEPDKSLSDEATFAGAAKRRPASEVSIGDERTLGGGMSIDDTLLDDIEVVDLTAFGSPPQPPRSRATPATGLLRGASNS